MKQIIQLKKKKKNVDGKRIAIDGVSNSKYECSAEFFFFIKTNFMFDSESRCKLCHLTLKTLALYQLFSAQSEYFVGKVSREDAMLTTETQIMVFLVLQNFEKKKIVCNNPQSNSLLVFNEKLHLIFQIY